VLRGVAVLTVGRALTCKATKVKFVGIQDFAKKGKSEATKDIVSVSGDIGLVCSFSPFFSFEFYYSLKL
jgi:hypothetical protein